MKQTGYVVLMTLNVVKTPYYVFVKPVGLDFIAIHRFVSGVGLEDNILIVGYQKVPLALYQDLLARGIERHRLKSSSASRERRGSMRGG